MRFNRTAFSTVLAASILSPIALSAQSPICPSLPNLLRAEVTAHVSYDPATKLYSYSYQVENHAESLQALETFALETSDSAVQEVSSPPGWTYVIASAPVSINWAATQVADPDAMDSDGAVPESTRSIKPAHHTSGFTLTSSLPPGPVKYYVLGVSDIPPQDDEEAAETLAENCSESVAPLLQSAVVGVTNGPANFVPLKVRFPGEIEMSGGDVIRVSVRVPKSVNVSDIDPTSIELGPGSAHPLDIILDSGEKEHGDREEGEHSLTATFDVSSIGLTCRDSAMFLRANLKDGRKAQGGSRVELRGCELKKRDHDSRDRS